MNDYQFFDDTQRARIDDLKTRYRLLYEDPEHCEPMFVITTPQAEYPTWEERLADPRVMLKPVQASVKWHLELEDDCVPAARVDFGTAQVAYAFGCAPFLPKNNLPTVKNHALKNISDIYRLEIPPIDAGWYGKLKHFTEFFLENLPDGIPIALPDIQSAFNSAHLIRGNDILLDFYDEPEAVEVLLDKVTDFMIALVPELNKQIGADGEWFYDWYAYWKGAARISNCTTHLISPDLYREYVLPRDIRFLTAVGGGRIHYCGSYGAVIDSFVSNPIVTGLDYDTQHHDLWEISERVPSKMPVLQSIYKNQINRLLEGDWPKKRNLIFQLFVGSFDEGRDLLSKLRESFRRNRH